MSQPTSAPAAPPQPHYPPPPRKTEKEKMLHGEPFMPFDEQLMEERAHCTGAVYSFNCTGNPSVQIGRGDRERNFKRIVAAGWIHPRHMDRRLGVPNGGHCGGSVTVATPFHCDYGYNISLGDNVVIGPHCQLLDSTRIAIGRNTRIGARVTISTIKTPTDAKSTKGNNGTEIAQQVYIGENVYIGDGVIIEAGIRIGNNAIVRSGSVVVRVSCPSIFILQPSLTISRTLPLILPYTAIQHLVDLSTAHAGCHTITQGLTAALTLHSSLFTFHFSLFTCS
jgi:acetyltransferase-like isoleucine patch superfamily enzyme